MDDLTILATSQKPVFLSMTIFQLCVLFTSNKALRNVGIATFFLMTIILSWHWIQFHDQSETLIWNVVLEHNLEVGFSLIIILAGLVTTTSNLRSR